jgi:hypothetical protein
MTSGELSCAYPEKVDPGSSSSGGTHQNYSKTIFEYYDPLESFKQKEETY